MFTVAVFGYGGRGKIYADNFHRLGIKVVAVCDFAKDRLSLAKKCYDGVDVYEDEKEFFSKGKVADVLIVATLDNQHYKPSIQAMRLGYDLILEKPISYQKEECDEIAKVAKETGRSITVCHVLRYAPFYAKIKGLLESGRFGKIFHLSMSEHVGYFHFAHSYVRGPWRNMQSSAPIILAKSCHDLDLLAWFVEEKCQKVSSFGDLCHFKSENAPLGHTKRCSDCPHKEECVYSAFRIYLSDEYERQAALARHGRLGVSKEDVKKTLSDGENSYGRCVYECDNNVFDRQVTNLQFESGVTAQFSLVAWGEQMRRTIHIFCEKGEIYGSAEGDFVKYRFYGDPFKEHAEEIIYEKEIYSSHGGGDMGLVKSFVENYGRCNKKMLSDIFLSLESHYMGFAIQASAEAGGCVVSVDKFRK